MGCGVGWQMLPLLSVAEYILDVVEHTCCSGTHWGVGGWVGCGVG